MEGEGKEEEADSVSSSDNSEPDARTIDWAKLATMMRNASPDAILAMKEHFTPKEKQLQRTMVLTPEETDTLNSGMGIPEVASVESDHTAIRPKIQQKLPTKPPPKENTLIVALEAVAEEQEVDEALIADLKL